MAKAKKLPSGAWRVLVYDYTDSAGKRQYRSFTADTKAEAEYQAADFARNKKKIKRSKVSLTVTEAIDKYLELSELLSPTTLAGYRKMQRSGFQDIMKMSTDKLTDDVMQLAINKESKRISERTGKPISGKTVKNEYGLLSSALKAVCGLSFDVKLPKVQAKNKILPEPELVLNAIYNTDIELPCLLAMCLSFSMSEIRGIRYSSINNWNISIDQVIVDVDNLPVVKENAKVETRKRVQHCTPRIIELIKAQEGYQRWISEGIDGYLINTSVHIIRNHYQAVMKAAGLNITFHDLRHEYASIMLNILNIPEGIVQDSGGWKTPHVMKGVYRNLFTDSRKKADAIRDDYFESAIQKIKEGQ